MTAEDCITRIKTVLEDDTNLKKYLRKVFLGIRSNLPKGQFPLIILEPQRKEERETIYPTERVIFEVMIGAYIQVRDADKQLIGDKNVKGLMDLERDILIALATDKTLNSNCIKFSFPQTAYDFTSYPIRGVNITMEILYEQNFDNRT